MKDPDKLKRRVPLYVMVSPDTKDFVNKLNQVSNISEGKIIDRAVEALILTEITL